MSDGNKCLLDIGVGILRFLRDKPLSWSSMCKEWIDNSYGARATRVVFRRIDDRVEISDDGEGCSDLRVMESIAKSINRDYDKAGMYGTGGIWSQIHASQGGKVEVTTVTNREKQTITINFSECLQANKFISDYTPGIPVPAGRPTGTTIRIFNAKRYGNENKILEDLGHAYAVELRAGRKIIFDTDGKRREVKPFQIPPFSARVEIDFVFQGHHITGFCGVVEEGVPNPHFGWSVHWGYRFAKTTTAPAGDHLPNRIYGEIYLPSSWKNINPTKDDFTSDADSFWEEIAILCDEVIRAADDQSTDLELLEASELASDLLTEAIAGGKARVKGRRPGSAGKQGTVEPTGNGSPHENFATTQPGSKPAEADGIPPSRRSPSRIRIAWEESLDCPYRMETSRTTMTITLNKSFHTIEQFKKDYTKLAVLCCFAIAHEKVSDPEYDGMFHSIVGEEYQEILSELLDRVRVAGMVATS
jgi:hypothetical protein